jgi:uncharacterized protein YajQ (UPF0234 family)
MADSSFDIVSKLDHQEIDNALNQAQRELTQRFDFKNTGAKIEWSGDHAVEITANAEDRALAVLDVFKDKLVKRNQSLKILDAGEPRQSELRVSSKKRDDLQAVIALVKEQDYDFAVQFTNYR